MTPEHRYWNAIGCLALSLLSACSTVATAETPAGIHVTGRGSVEVEPDMGYVALHSRREGDSASALKDELDTVVREVLELTARLSVADRDVTATAVSINPRYRRRDNETVVDGLVATRSISITLRNLDSFGELLKESLALGINNLDPIRLDSSRRSLLEDEALTLAMEDARREAAQVAAGFFVTLGAVTDVHVQEHSARPQEVRAMAMADGGAGSDFSPGVIRIERMVISTFAIGPSE